MNLAEALELNARARPDHPAIISGDITLSHADFVKDVRKAAAGFLAMGVATEDLVGVCLKDTVDHLVANYALARIGAVILPMDWRWSAGEMSRICQFFAPKLVVVENGAEKTTGLVETQMSTVRYAAANIDTEIAPGGEAPLLLSLSSGTTGRPKGPRIAHRHMLRRFWTHWINLGLNGQDRYLSASPLCFGAGRTFAMSVLFSGGTVILYPPPFEAIELLDEFERVQATSSFLVPTLLRKLLELPDAQLSSIRRLQLLIGSGAPLASAERSAVTERLCANFIDYYASTEGGGISISTAADRMRRPHSVGRPVFGVEIEVVGEDHIPLSTGQSGRLRYRGPGVAAKYYMDEEASSESFRDGWFYPGDIAEIDEAGYLILLGRANDVINRGGVKIYPSEIEAILREHPNIEEAAVVGVPSKHLGEEVAAFLVVRDRLDIEALAAWCSEQFAPYKVPKEFVVMEDLPRNSSGKVLKASLQSHFSA